MPQKPGGGGGGGISNGLKPETDFNLDLGKDRLPSEEMRLPDAKQFIQQDSQQF